MTETLKIGFVGASGMMGHGMAKNLVTKGFPLSYTVHRRDVDDLREAGATRAESLAALGRENDAVFICVTSAEDVAAAVTGPDGLLTNVLAGGDADSLAYIRPALEAFAENIIPIGEVGSATRSSCSRTSSSRRRSRRCPRRSRSRVGRGWTPRSSPM